MAADQGHSTSLTPTLIITVFITCFGSSMLYGFNIAVINLPGDYIKCFLGETLLGNPPCGDNDTSTSSANASNPDSSGKVTPSASSGNVDFFYALISGIFVVAGAIGAFLTGWLADFFGRRNGLLFNHIFIIIGGILVGPTVAAKAPALLFVGRVFIGFNCGVTIGLASIYLTEIAPRNVRGAIGACHQLAVTMGIVIGYILTLKFTLNTANLWSVACSLTVIPAVISLCTLPFCPESPRFLYLKKNQVEEARKAFLRVNKTEDVDLFLAELHEEVEFTKSQPKFQFSQLFTQRDLRMPLIIACLIQIMQQLSGINAVMTYSSDMLKKAGVMEASIEYCVLGIGIFNVVCTIVSLPMLERFGRRTLLLWPSIALAVSLALLTITVNVANSTTSSNVKQNMAIASTILIFLYIAGFAMGLGPVPALLVAEIFRQGPRGAAYSVSQFIQWSSALLVLVSYPNMNKAIDGYSFLPFLVVVVACWIFFFLFMPETRGRTFDDVARDLAFGNVVIFKKAATFYPEPDTVEKGETKPLVAAVGHTGAGGDHQDNRNAATTC